MFLSGNKIDNGTSLIIIEGKSESLARTNPLINVPVGRIFCTHYLILNFSLGGFVSNCHGFGLTRNLDLLHKSPKTRDMNKTRVLNRVSKEHRLCFTMHLNNVR